MLQSSRYANKFVDKEVILSLKTRAIQGVFWAAASIFGARLLNLLATLMLAKLLVPSDFGLVAVAHLVVTTAQVFRDLGLAQALIYRSDDAEEAVPNQEEKEATG